MKFKLISILVFMTLCSPAVGLAAEQGGQVKELQAEILLMKQSFNELLQLLKSQQQKTDEFQKLQIAVTYLSFRSRSIELKEYDLRQKKEARERLEETIVKIEADPDEWDQRDRGMQSSHSGQSSLTDSRLSERRIKMLRERIETLDTDILKAELEIQELKDELAIYDAYVQKRLNFED